MSKRDFYEVLGVEQNAEDREIKKAYKRLAMKFHPDRNREDPQAEEKFKEVKEAYEILTDPQKRAAYDNTAMPVLTRAWAPVAVVLAAGMPISAISSVMCLAIFWWWSSPTACDPGCRSALQHGADSGRGPRRQKRSRFRPLVGCDECHGSGAVGLVLSRKPVRPVMAAVKCRCVRASLR